MDGRKADAKGAREARELAMHGTTAIRANKLLVRSHIFVQSAEVSTSVMLALPMEHD